MAQVGCLRNNLQDYYIYHFTLQVEVLSLYSITQKNLSANAYPNYLDLDQCKNLDLITILMNLQQINWFGDFSIKKENTCGTVTDFS